MSEPTNDDEVTVDHGPADSYHPIYDSVVEWLDGEQQANPTILAPSIRPSRPRKPGTVPST